MLRGTPAAGHGDLTRKFRTRRSMRRGAATTLFMRRGAPVMGHGILSKNICENLRYLRLDSSPRSLADEADLVQ